MVTEREKRAFREPRWMCSVSRWQRRRQQHRRMMAMVVCLLHEKIFSVIFHVCARVSIWKNGHNKFADVCALQMYKILRVIRNLPTIQHQKKKKETTNNIVSEVIWYYYNANLCSVLAASGREVHLCVTQNVKNKWFSHTVERKKSYKIHETKSAQNVTHVVEWANGLHSCGVCYCANANLFFAFKEIV